MMALGSRVADERKALGWSQDELADKVTRLGFKIHQTTIDKIEKRDSQRPRCAPELARALGVSERWLISGKGMKVQPPETPPETGRTVRIISWVSAGIMTGDDLSQVEVGSMDIAGLDPKGDWIALRVEGDSMDKISPPGSLVIVNRRDTSLVPNACYIIGDGEGKATYKRYRPGPMRFEPVSTRSDHETFFPDNHPTIIGRVRKSVIDL